MDKYKVTGLEEVHKDLIQEIMGKFEDTYCEFEDDIMYVDGPDGYKGTINQLLDLFRTPIVFTKQKITKQEIESRY